MPAPNEFAARPGTTASLGDRRGTTPVQVTQFAEQPRTQQADQIRQILGTAGRTAVNVVLTEQRIKDVARQARERTNAELVRVRQDIARKDAAALSASEAAAKRAMDLRMREVQRTQFQILRDERSTNPEWVLNEAVQRQQNAGYPEEKDAWNNFIIQFQERARADEAQAKREAERLANEEFRSEAAMTQRTAQLAVDRFRQSLLKDDAARAELIGDGKNITDRVMDRIAEIAVGSAPYLFNISDNDPFAAEKQRMGDELLLAMQHRSLDAVATPLIQESINLNNAKSEIRGRNEVDAAAVRYAEGDISARQFVQTVEDIAETAFAHKSEPQREQLLLQVAEQAMDELSSLTHIKDPTIAMFRAEQMLDALDIPDAMKNRIIQHTVQQKLIPAIQMELQQEFNDLIEARTEPRVLPDGTTMPGDMREGRLSLLERDETGATGYMRYAASKLIAMGIDPNDSELSELGRRVRVGVQESVERAEAQAAQLQGKIDSTVQARVRALEGQWLDREEAKGAWEQSPLRQYLRNEITPGGELDQTLRRQMRQMGMDPDDRTAVAKALAASEGGVWRHHPHTPVPNLMAQDLGEMLRSGMSDQIEIAANFWNHIGPIQQKALMGNTSISKADSLVLRRLTREMNAAGPNGLTHNDIVRIANESRQFTEARVQDADALAAASTDVLQRQKNPHHGWEDHIALRDTINSVWPGAIETKRRLTFGDGRPTRQRLEQELIDLLGDRSDLRAIFQEAHAVAAIQGKPFEVAVDEVMDTMVRAGLNMVETPHGPRLIQDPVGHTAWDDDAFGFDDSDPRSLTGTLVDIALFSPGATIYRAATQRSTAKGPRPDETRISFGMRKVASAAYDFEEAVAFGQRVGLGDRSQKALEARQGQQVSMNEIILLKLSETLGVAPGQLPNPSEWEWVPEEWSGPHAQRWLSVSPEHGGGLPMMLKIPGYDQPFRFAEANGDPLIRYSQHYIRPETRSPDDYMGVINDWGLSTNNPRRQRAGQRQWRRLDGSPR